MILVIDFNVKELSIRAFSEKRPGAPSVSVVNADDVRGDAELVRYIRDAAGKEPLTAIAWRVLFGGDLFDAPAMVNGGFFARFGRLTEFFPLYVPSTLDLLKRVRALVAPAPVIAFFETAFFSRLPDEEKYYALPFEYGASGAPRKYGYHGIFHQANARLMPPDSKTISVVFDKQTTVCAASHMRPVSISLGYTPLEGVMSARACGDLDPGIALYLMNVHGFSIHEIDDMLKNRSGFLGLTGYDLEPRQMIRLRGKDAKVALAFDIYEAQILKHIAEGLAALGGLDNIAIAGANVDAMAPVIHGIMKKMSFLGVNAARLPWERRQAVTCVTSGESKVRVLLNRTDLATILYRECRANIARKTKKYFRKS